MKNFPSDDTILQTRKGDAFAHKLDVFAGIIWFAYKSEPNNLMPLPVDKVKEIIAINKQGKPVAQLEDFVQKQVKKVEYDNIMGQDDLTRFDKK